MYTQNKLTIDFLVVDQAYQASVLQIYKLKELWNRIHDLTGKYPVEVKSPEEMSENNFYFLVNWNREAFWAFKGKLRNTIILNLTLDKLKEVSEETPLGACLLRCVYSGQPMLYVNDAVRIVSENEPITAPKKVR
ncbi:hypothetical protein [Neolewinella antarctica]|uniref:Uncharacterized protein n=1 Tax=Neolewinella antarctica TaxID=442734 RepID=A0ABX0XEF6_9BACT|nr:hypothetical protein [Neolewinella antarctica]NJC27698.1 hypothetical protein [Neolewinella antarctica]